jgi:hypothetical protein
MQTVPRLGPRARLGAPSNTMPVSASGGAWRPPTGFRLWMHLYKYVRSVCRRAQGLTRVPCPPLCAHKNTFAPFLLFQHNSATLNIQNKPNSIWL